jgi:N-acetylglucosamine malate deacetylase 1
MMGGTMCLLVDRGWEAHYLSLANGSLGTASRGPEDIVLERARESGAGAAHLGATRHPSLVNDAEIRYSIDLIRRVTAVVREVRPTIVLTQAPDDYMEDHAYASRVTATAAFNRNMPNFPSLPPAASYGDDVYVYHAQPHGLHDQLRRLVFPGLYVDIGTVIDRKRAALEAHVTQVSWLGDNQAMSSPAAAMVDMSRMVGRMSGRYEVAEGWRRHSHLGFSAHDTDPLAAALSDVAHVDEDYERMLRSHPVTGVEFTG